LGADANLLFNRAETEYPDEAIIIAGLLLGMSDEERERVSAFLAVLADLLK
jgi:hypothetical protein